MATIDTALVVLTIPSTDPNVDAVSVSLVYAQDGGDTGTLVAHCNGLFNVLASGAEQTIGGYISPVMDRGTNHCTTEVYDISTTLDGAPHGSPVDMGTWTLTAPGTSQGQPEGVAAACSYRADYGTDVEFAPGARPRARDRNRHYYGPLTTTALQFGGTANRCKFASQFITDCLADTKQVEVIDETGFVFTPGPAQWNLRVWSRKNAITKPVFEYWMDDRVDYQRRRADQPGTKYYLAA